MWDSLNMQASLATSGMPLIALDLTQHMLWDNCGGLSIDLVMSIDKLLIGSWDSQIKPWTLDYVIKHLCCPGKIPRCKAPYQMIPKRPVYIYLISLEELFLRKSKKQKTLA